MTTNIAYYEHRRVKTSNKLLFKAEVLMKIITEVLAKHINVKICKYSESSFQRNCDLVVEQQLMRYKMKLMLIL